MPMPSILRVRKVALDPVYRPPPRGNDHLGGAWPSILRVTISRESWRGESGGTIRPAKIHRRTGRGVGPAWKDPYHFPTASTVMSRHADYPAEETETKYAAVFTWNMEGHTTE